MKKRIKNYLLRHLLCAITLEDVITVEKGIIHISGHKITVDELNQLRAEAKAMEGFRLWNIMSNSVRYIANDKIFNKSLNFEDVMAGKLMLLNLDTQKSILDVIKSHQ